MRHSRPGSAWPSSGNRCHSGHKSLLPYAPAHLDEPPKVIRIFRPAPGPQNDRGFVGIHCQASQLVSYGLDHKPLRSSAISFGLRGSTMGRRAALAPKARISATVNLLRRVPSLRVRAPRGSPLRACRRCEPRSCPQAALFHRIVEAWQSSLKSRQIMSQFEIGLQ